MRVILATSLEHALDEVQAAGIVPMAGGTDLLVHWPQNAGAQARTYLDLSGVSQLRSMRWSAGHLHLGALSTYWDVVSDPRVGGEFPMLVAAARQVGAIQIQSRGTWAGNIANGSPAADGVLALMALEATVTLASARGEREVPLDGYYTGYRASVRAPDELVTAVNIPRMARDRQVFEKVGPRRAQAITKVGVAAVKRGDGAWCVAANSVAPTVRRCAAVEAFLSAGSPAKSARDFLPALLTDVAPIDDIRSTAEYRRTVLANLLFHGCR